MKIINVDKAHRLYTEVDSLVIIMAALTVSTQYYSPGGVTLHPGQPTVFDSLVTGKMVKFPAFGPIQAVIADQKPDLIEIRIEDYAPPQRTYAVETSAVQKTINYVFMPFFVTFYEKHVDAARDDFGTNYDTWPASWRMGWVARNALAHNGKIFYSLFHIYWL